MKLSLRTSLKVSQVSNCANLFLKILKYTFFTAKLYFLINCCLFFHFLVNPAVVIEKPKIEASCELACLVVEKTDTATAPILFLEEENDRVDKKTVKNKTKDKIMIKICPSQKNYHCKSTQTTAKLMFDNGTCVINNTCTFESEDDSRSNKKSYSKVVCKCSCTKNVSDKSNSSNIKLYTSLALAGLFAIFFAVSSFSPEIYKTYSWPPPL